MKVKFKCNECGKYDYYTELDNREARRYVRIRKCKHVFVCSECCSEHPLIPDSENNIELRILGYY